MNEQRTVFLLWRQDQHGVTEIGGVFATLNAADNAGRKLWPPAELNPFRPFQWDEPKIMEMQVRDA